MTTSRAFNKPDKVLTDFSIKTIIGNASNNHDHQHHNQRQHLIQPRDNDNMTSNIFNQATKEDSITSFTQRLAATTTFGHQLTSVAASNQSNPIRKYRPKNFICPVCDMGFSNNGQLKTHVRIHTGERPFRCNYPDCNKTFTRNEELTRHKLIHTGDRPHSCSTCGKRFGRKDHLKKHARTHDRKKHREVFVPGGAAFIEGEDVFSPPKPTNRLNSEPQGANRLTTMASHSPTSSDHDELAHLIPATSSEPPIPIPASSIVDHYQQFHNLSMTLTTITPPTMQASNPSATSAIEQLASDYWAHKWYNLMGYYHHQAPLNLSTG